MLAGKLDRRITIRRLGSGQSSSGEPNGTWSDLATVWAQKIEARGDERFSTAQPVGSISRSFRFRWSTTVKDVNDKDKIVFDGVEHDIVAVREIGRREGIEVDCTARGENAVVQGAA